MKTPAFTLRLLLASLLVILTSAAAYAYSWTPDTAALGPSFETLTISLRPDLPVTIIRPAAKAEAQPRGVLYIHGFNDYFFQAEEADSFVARGYAFYAIDLQRYGRSLRPGQTPCDARHGLDEYFPAIDSALSVMRACGVDTIALMGHSTGGLTAAYYLARRPDAPVDALILNSPFLAWNLGRLNKAIPLVEALGAIAPGLKLRQGASDAYAASVMASRHGRWHYRTDWKAIHSPDVTAGWVRSITMAQNYLRHHPGCIRVPTLLITSMRGYDGSQWSPEASAADAVLSPQAIRRIGVTLPAAGATDVVVDGALHDVFLSSPAVTRPLYRYLFAWLADTL